MPKHRVYPKELLQEIIPLCESWSQVCKALGRRQDGSINTRLKRHAEEFEIDTSHFKGQGANYGENHKGGVDAKPAKQVLVLSNKKEKHDRLHNCLQEIGRLYKCAWCSLGSTWNNKTIVLHIDHINGNRFDHSPYNLRYLCPNCHSQTETYTGRNNKKQKFAKMAQWLDASISKIEF